MADDDKEDVKSKTGSSKDGEEDDDGMKGESEDDGTVDCTSDEKNDGEEKEGDDKKPAEPVLKKKITNWPMRDIKDPSPNDVLFGRGGGTNHQ